jgi:hypothetical protein
MDQALAEEIRGSAPEKPHETPRPEREASIIRFTYTRTVFRNGVNRGSEALTCEWPTQLEFLRDIAKRNAEGAKPIDHGLTYLYLTGEWYQGAGVPVASTDNEIRKPR